MSRWKSSVDSTERGSRLHIGMEKTWRKWSKKWAKLGQFWGHCVGSCCRPYLEPAPPGHMDYKSQ